jgi:hypothetical protein
MLPYNNDACREPNTTPACAVHERSLFMFSFVFLIFWRLDTFAKNGLGAVVCLGEVWLRRCRAGWRMKWYLTEEAHNTSSSRQ